MRVLLSSIIQDHMDSAFAEVLQRVDAEPCGVVFLDLKDPNRFPETKAFAKHAFSYEDCRNARYTEHSLYSECPPLEPELIEKMAPYESEIFHMLSRDRLLDYRNMWHEYCEHLRFWNHALDVMKIDVFVSIFVPHVPYDAVITGLCKLRKIPIATLLMSNLFEYFHPVNTLDDPCPQMRDVQERLRVEYQNAPAEEIPLTPPFEERYQSFRRPDVDLTPFYVDRPVSNGAVPAIIDGFFAPVLSGKASLFRKNDLYKKYLYKYSFWRYWRCIFKRVKLLLLLSVSVFSFNIEKYKKIRRKFFSYTAYLEYEVLYRQYQQLSSRPKEGEEFIYVPLHMQPELTTCPLGGVFADQLLMVRMLSAHLPKGYRLYIKEHPDQIRNNLDFPAARHAEFYEEMAKLENVRLMPMDADTYELQDKCVAVATVTGTAGFEAINKGKPFLMFGRYITMYAPGVFSIRSNSDCREAMRWIAEKNTHTLSEKDLRIYYKALEECTFMGTFWWQEAHHGRLKAGEFEIARSNIIEVFIGLVTKLFP